MKEFYSLSVPETWKPCVADLIPPLICSHWRITRINVPVAARHNGYGRRLLETIIVDADNERLDLCVEPHGSDGPTTTELISWYEKYGFVFVNTTQCAMVRTWNE